MIQVPTRSAAAHIFASLLGVLGSRSSTVAAQNCSSIAVVNSDRSVNGTGDGKDGDTVLVACNTDFVSGVTKLDSGKYSGTPASTQIVTCVNGSFTTANCVEDPCKGSKSDGQVIKCGCFNANSNNYDRFANEDPYTTCTFDPCPTDGIVTPLHGNLGSCAQYMNTSFEHGETCAQECDRGYTMQNANVACAEGETGDAIGDLGLQNTSCVADPCTGLITPKFGDWGTCPETGSMQSGTASNCKIECSTGYLCQPAVDNTDNDCRRECLAGKIMRDPTCIFPIGCGAGWNSPGVSLPSNSTLGTCPVGMELEHAASCNPLCLPNYNASGGGISCYNGEITYDLLCTYVEPTIPPLWVQVGHRVEYKFRKTSDADPSLCVDGPCIMDPQWGDVYYGGAGVNVTLAETYTQLQEDFLTFEFFAKQFAQEMGQLLRIRDRRVKVFRIRPTEVANAESPGSHPDGGDAANGVVVEFIICQLLCVPDGGPWYGFASRLDEREVPPTDERGPSQAADVLIEYYYKTEPESEDYKTNVLYKYSYRLALLAKIVRPTAEFDAWIDVIKTCGQDPCDPVMQGRLEWIVGWLFAGSVLIVAIVVMTHGRGCLAKIRELTG